MGCTVDTLTLAMEQKKYIEQKIKGTDLESRIHVHLLDYRNMPREWEGKFDAFCSLEMLEVSSVTNFHHPSDDALTDVCLEGGGTDVHAGLSPSDRLGAEKRAFSRRFDWCHIP